MTHAELRARMTTRELTEWRALDVIEPIGDRRADYHAALTCYIIASAAGVKGLKAEDFLLNWGQDDNAPTPESSVNVIAALNAVLGGVDSRPTPVPAPEVEQ